MLLYAFGIFGLQLFIGYVNSYQAQFYTSVYGANLMVVAAIILAAKIIGGPADFIIGNVIDGSDLKGGKMRPFVFISAFLLAILSTIMFVFIPFSSKAGMYVYVSFITVLWNVAMSFADIPSQGLLSLISPTQTKETAWQT